MCKRFGFCVRAGFSAGLFAVIKLPPRFIIGCVDTFLFCASDVSIDHVLGRTKWLVCRN